jgi:hypothetical protein
VVFTVSSPQALQFQYIILIPYILDDYSVPRLLTEEQKDNRVNVCRDLKEELRNDPNFLTKIFIPTDEENTEREAIQ